MKYAFFERSHRGGDWGGNWGCGRSFCSLGSSVSQFWKPANNKTKVSKCLQGALQHMLTVRPFAISRQQVCKKFDNLDRGQPPSWILTVFGVTLIKRRKAKITSIYS
jgi:hypothetical protein